MELAVNMFTGGMVLDSHPLVQSSDTLSDALNATYITMNGNEVVLLNDMGNRRVDNAYLPAGYEPVGIKEHGGIIYIAAYNPITHRSQIGSFPSPERNMGTEYKDNGTEFNFSKFTSKNNIIVKSGIRFLKDDILLFPLTKDTSLHAGDKFTVYSDDIWGWKNYITNFGVEDENGSHMYENTPFNSYFTLSLGVMNSLNEFSDITSSLERFNSLGEIIKGLDSDEAKFNTGYFIAPNNWELANNGLTGDDATLLENRGKIGANTYAYKLTGPLYLKAEINHILTFSYDMDISKEMVNGIKITIYLTGTASYDCPDSNNPLDEKAYFDSFKFLYKPLNNPWGNYITANLTETLISNDPRVYDLVTGLYISTITKKYILIIPFEYLFSTLNYLIAVPLFHNPILNLELEGKVYINNLSETGTLDISKIGTNYCELDSWRYKNTITDNKIKTTLINYRFECYTDSNTKFLLKSITLTNLTTPSLSSINLGSIVSLQSNITNGRLELLIDWDKVTGNKINFLDLYLVEIKFYKESLPEDIITRYRFILGTELFNPCYDEINEENFVSDFGIFMGELSGNTASISNLELTLEEIDIRNKYLSLGINNIEISDPTIFSTNVSESLNGAPIYLDLNHPDFAEKTFTKTLNIEYSTNNRIKNYNLYPNTLNNNITDLQVTVTLGKDNIEKIVNNEQIISLGDQSQVIDSFKQNIITIPSNDNDIINNGLNKISYNIILKDRINIEYIKENRIIGKAYVDVDGTRYRDKIINIMSESLSFTGIGVYIKSSDTDIGGINYYENKNDLITDRDTNGKYWWGEDDADYSVWTEQFLYTDTDFMEGSTSMSDMYDEGFMNYFKNLMKCPFTFMLFEYSDDYTGFSDGISTRDGWGYKEDYATDFPASSFCRVWTIDEDGNPCLLNNFDTTGQNRHGGLFCAGDVQSTTESKLNSIYTEILTFIGEIRYDVRGASYSTAHLVMPLENSLIELYYPSTSSYLYCSEADYTIKNTVNYHILSNSSKITGSENLCLQFFVDNIDLNITKEVSYNYSLDSEYSLSIIDLASLYDLSSYSIYVDQSPIKILSNKDPLSHLYIKKDLESEYILKEVPNNFPLLLNLGSKYNFPIVCKKKYSSSNRTYIGNATMFAYRDWLGIKTFSTLHPHTKRIPVLYEEDLTIPSNFFNT